MGGVNFADKFVNLGGGEYKSLAEAKAAGAAVIAYGSFINVVIDFIIVAVCIFMIIKAMNTMTRRLAAPASAAAPTTKDCPHCLSAIPIKATRCAHCCADVK